MTASPERRILNKGANLFVQWFDRALRHGGKWELDDLHIRFLKARMSQLNGGSQTKQVVGQVEATRTNPA